MVIEKSQDEIEQIIAIVYLSNLSEGMKPFVIGCIFDLLPYKEHCSFPVQINFG